MKPYRCAEIGQLAHELTLSPLRLRLRQVAGITRTIELIDPKREYPYHFVCYHITGHRPRRTDDTVLDGKALTADLVALLDALTAANPLPQDAGCGRLYDAGALARRFKVSTKTISRWRKRGLGGCWYDVQAEKPRLAFSSRDVERFVGRHQDLVRRGSTFQQMTRAEKDQIIARARELVATEKCGLHVATVKLAEETGRAVETIRYSLRRFDRENPEEALFDRIERAIEIDEDTVIYQAFVAGDSVAALAGRFDKREVEIRRILTGVRATELLNGPIAYIYHESFDAPDAEQQILDEAADGDGDAENGHDVTLMRIPNQLPAYLRHLYRTPLLSPKEEAGLFRRMNFLLHQGEVMRQRLESDAAAVAARAIAEIDDLLDRAAAIKSRITQANLRLVVSIAKRHLQGAGATGLFELISDGNIALMRAVEKFDYAKGFRFSTYASWAVRRCYARSIPEEYTRVSRFQTGHEEVLAGARDNRAAEEAPPDAAVLQKVRAALAESLCSLEDRERSIVERHFGLVAEGGAKTLDEIGREFGISKERVRQIEQRALRKLRSTLGERGEQLLAG